MNDFFKRHKDLAIISALFIITLFALLSNLNEKKSLNVVERAVMTVFAPFQESVSWAVGKISFTWDNYVSLLDVRKNNIELKMMAEKLAFENTFLVERLKHYKRVESLLSFPGIENLSFMAASVIGRDITRRVKQVTINIGSSHGVEENMPVVTHRGLVGRVVRTALNSSKVLLITDIRSAIDALVQESRDGLVVAGSNNEALDTRYMAVTAKVNAGDRVISSGFGGVFPKGLLIGTLADVHMVKDSLFMSAKIRPVADLKRLEEVLVLRRKIVPGHEVDFE